MGQIFLEEGVERVDHVEGWFDGNAPEQAAPSGPTAWRQSRREPRRLTACIETEGDEDRIILALDETVFVDASSLNVIVT